MPVLIKGSGGAISPEAVCFQVKPTDRTAISLSGIEDVFKDIYTDIGFCTVTISPGTYAPIGYVDVLYMDNVDGGYTMYIRDDDDIWLRRYKKSEDILSVTKDGFKIDLTGQGNYFSTDRTYFVIFTKASAMKG